MTVGIMTMHRVRNCGSFLQAYALKNIVEERGHSVQFVDFYVDRSHMVKNQKSLKKYLTMVSDKFKWEMCKLFTPQKAKIRKHRNEYVQLHDKCAKQYLGIADELNLRPKLDLLIIGSDETLGIAHYINFNIPWPWELYGDNSKAKKKITYAASCGITTIEQIKSLGIFDKAAELLKTFDDFSVRDENTLRYVKELTGRTPPVNIDPALLYNFPDSVLKTPNRENYILVYSYTGRINSKKEISAIKDFAKSKNKRLICCNEYQWWCDEMFTVSPLELLGWFANADYVITDTFHGTLFSIKYNKQFVSFVRDSNQYKLNHLLELLGGKDRVVKDPKKLGDILNTRIDYSSINKRIAEEKQKAFEYLDKHIRV